MVMVLLVVKVVPSVMLPDASRGHNVLDANPTGACTGCSKVCPFNTGVTLTDPSKLTARKQHPSV